MIRGSWTYAFFSSAGIIAEIAMRSNSPSVMPPHSLGRFYRDGVSVTDRAGSKIVPVYWNPCERVFISRAGLLDVLTVRSSARWRRRLLGIEWTDAAKERIPSRSASSRRLSTPWRGRTREAPLAWLAWLPTLAPLAGSAGSRSTTGSRRLILSGEHECPLVVVIAAVVQPDGLLSALAGDADEPAHAACDRCSAASAA
jgi:hypothetical protein